MRELLRQLTDASSQGRAAACCRLVETRGSTPQKAGAMMIVFADGSQAGTLGGGCVEAEVKRQTLAILESRTAEIAKFRLDDDYGWDDKYWLHNQHYKRCKCVYRLRGYLNDSDEKRWI